MTVDKKCILSSYCMPQPVVVFPVGLHCKESLALGDRPFQVAEPLIDNSLPDRLKRVVLKPLHVAEESGEWICHRNNPGIKP